eukprot:jgi/Picsp_1/4092/NSC_01602-R1_one-helix protein
MMQSSSVFGSKVSTAVAPRGFKVARRSGAKRGRLGAVSSSDDPALGKPPVQEKADSSPSCVAMTDDTSNKSMHDISSRILTILNTNTYRSVTIEYQRKQAKAMQQYLRDQSLEAAIEQSKVFGWTVRNEINNGRWVMMGLAIGMLTEYATGVDFINQLKLMRHQHHLVVVY